MQKQQLMPINTIFVNLPVRDIAKARAFWTKLGFSFNEQFSDEKSLCLILNEGRIYAMLLAHDFFKTFTNRPIADNSTTQVVLAIQVNSREQVDCIVQLALKSGASRYKEPVDHGWMYYDSFADPDGHQWEIMYSDPTKIQQ